MSAQQYFSFFEKITRKMAQTFMELNQICLQEMANIQHPPTPSYSPPKNIQTLEEPPASPIEVDSPVEEPIFKSPKTKKIKKDTTVEEEEKESQSIKGKKKQKKVSHKPKAPASSFLLFFKDQQPKFAEAYPSYGVTELTRVAAKIWNELSNQQKEPYIKQGDQERKKYQEKMQQYRIQFPHEIAEKEKDRLLKKEKKTGARETAKKQKVEMNTPKSNLQENKVQAMPEAQKGAEEEEWQSAEPGDDIEDSLGEV